MTRVFRPTADQLRTHYLRSSLCRLGTPADMAAVSSHLRNYAVAEAIGLLGTLDSHPTIKARPTIARSGAQFQQARGTADNHFAHVAPCSLNIDGRPLQALFTSPEGRDHVERVFGMGVMAPSNWQSLGTFAHVPATQNRTDVTAEGHHSSTGLVSAFEATCRGAAATGKWVGDGTHQHNRSSLADYVEHYFQSVWKPSVLAAYTQAQGSLAESRASTDLSGHKIGLLSVQISVLHVSNLDFGAIADTLIASTSHEPWAG